MVCWIGTFQDDSASEPFSCSLLRGRWKQEESTCSSHIFSWGSLGAWPTFYCLSTWKAVKSITQNSIFCLNSLPNNPSPWILRPWLSDLMITGSFTQLSSRPFDFSQLLGSNWKSEIIGDTPFKVLLHLSFISFSPWGNYLCLFLSLHTLHSFPSTPSQLSTLSHTLLKE